MAALLEEVDQLADDGPAVTLVSQALQELARSLNEAIAAAALTEGDCSHLDQLFRQHNEMLGVLVTELHSVSTRLRDAGIDTGLGMS